MVKLTEDELESAMNELIEGNAKEIERCSEKAIELCRKDDNLKYGKVLTSLFDKQATASFSLINAKIDEKIQRMR
jgi:hypothetical protein